MLTAWIVQRYNNWGAGRPRSLGLILSTSKQPPSAQPHTVPESHLAYPVGTEVLWGLGLRRCVTSRTVPGSIPGGVTGFFSDIFLSYRTMALGSTQPLVKISTSNIPGGKGGRCVRLTSRAECHEIWEPKPPGTVWALSCVCVCVVSSAGRYVSTSLIIME
jgi:hypothetical protein